MKRIGLVLAACLGVFGGAPGAQAQDYPSKPVHIIVPWPPGGNIDITARTIQNALSEALGQAVIVDNRPGAGGTIGSALVAKSPPDGYTLLLGSSGTITNAPAVYKNITYDPIKDLTSVGPIQSTPMVLTAALKTPVANYKEFVAYAQAHPDAVSVASAGNGSSNHLMLELFIRASGLKLVHVPYKGSGPAINDLLGGQVDAMSDQLTASIAHIRSGRIRVLAVTSKVRSPILPNVPTVAESIPGFEATTFTGIFGPSGMPKAVIDKLYAALKKTMANDTVRERFAAMGVDIMDMNQADFTAYVHADFEKWRSIARERNIVIE
jgi:tripartite-type tricarboxylate transporter receptor subunit TctC